MPFKRCENSLSVITTLLETAIGRNASFSTKASQFNDWELPLLYNALIEKVNAKFTSLDLKSHEEQNVSEESTIIPPKRVRYLSEIVDNNKTTINKLRNKR